MQPFTPDEKKTMLSHTAAAFPNRRPADFETELGEYEFLLSTRFTTESGVLPPVQQQRLDAFTQQFRPQP